jgi:ABC-type thiamin/hydroxymethylpyrimidine transport system permease subunit
MDFYDIRAAVLLGISLGCIFWIYMIVRRNPQKTLFGKPVPSNLMPTLIGLFVVAVVVAVVFKPAPPQYIVIESTAEAKYVY